MKLCSTCGSQFNDTASFCPQCGSRVSSGESDVAVAPVSPNSLWAPSDSRYPAVPDGDETDAALAFVYIAQWARSDGQDTAGVLVEDCKRHFQAIHRLVIQGAVEERNWYQLRGYATASSASGRAESIIQRRLDQSGETLKSVLDRLPLKFLQFFRTEVLATDQSDALRLERTSTPSDVNDRYHLCLLNDNRVRRFRDDVIGELIRLGLAETANTYVATGGGRIVGRVYCLPPLVRAFFDKYIVSTGKVSVGPLFDESLEAKHRLYHRLEDAIVSPSKQYLGVQAIKRLSMERGALRADLDEVLRKLEVIQAVKVDPSRMFVEKPKEFLEIIREAFLAPLVESLLSSFAGQKQAIIGPSSSLVDPSK